MVFSPKSLLAATAALLVAPLLAQGPICPTNQVVGWSDLPAPATTSTIDTQDIDNACQAATTLCKPMVPLRAAVFYGGGTAYDQRYQSVWVSDGGPLYEYSLVTCNSPCKQTPALINPAAVISGLAIADRKPRLFHLATIPGYMEIVTYDNTKCPPVAIARCSQTFTGKEICAGLAYDEVNDLLFIAQSTQLATGGWTTLVFVSLASSPCQFICKFQVLQCSGQPCLGLAFDSCKNILYATDGQITESLAVASARQCVVRSIGCCKKQISPVYRGLCLIPGWRGSPVGKGCTRTPCPACPGVTMTSGGGDPGLGNPNFHFNVSGAPSGSFGVFVLSAGPCLAAGIPFGCGLIHPNLFGPSLIFPAMILPGMGGCTGTGNFALPIPVAPGLCGQIFCAQTVLFCVPPPIGVGLTNAYQFQITGG